MCVFDVMRGWIGKLEEGGREEVLGCIMGLTDSRMWSVAFLFYPVPPTKRTLCTVLSL